MRIEKGDRLSYPLPYKRRERRPQGSPPVIPSSPASTMNGLLRISLYRGAVSLIVQRGFLADTTYSKSSFLDERLRITSTFTSMKPTASKRLAKMASTGSRTS